MSATLVIKTHDEIRTLHLPDAIDFLVDSIATRPHALPSGLLQAYESGDDVVLNILTATDQQHVTSVPRAAWLAALLQMVTAAANAASTAGAGHLATPLIEAISDLSQPEPAKQPTTTVQSAARREQHEEPCSPPRAPEASRAPSYGARLRLVHSQELVVGHPANHSSELRLVR